jgi:hypothetical protein
MQCAARGLVAVADAGGAMLLTMVFFGGWLSRLKGMGGWVGGGMGDLIIIHKYIIIRISENYFKLRYFWLLYFQHTYGGGIH